MKTTIELAREAGFETMLRKGKILGFDRDGDYTEELKAFEALIRADERADMQKGFAGVKLWLGDAQVTQLVTEVEIQHERVPGTALKQAAEKCLAIYAGARGNP
jgi:hypothetical protein